MEIKFNRELEGKQKAFFEEFPADNKIIVNGMDDFLNLE